MESPVPKPEFGAVRQLELGKDSGWPANGLAPKGQWKLAG